MTRRLSLLAGTALLAATAALPAWAGPQIGSGNVAVIEPPIVVPKETPCVVPLVSGVTFGANNATYSFTPPSACPAPWAKVVLTVDVSLDKGIQYDRTGTLWMAGVPLWFGTTAEPNPQLGPRWHIERDVTDYTALFKTPQTGFELITNYTNSTDTSIITSSAALHFYPANATYPAPVTADLVLPFSAPGGGTVALNTPTDTLSTTVTLPTNVKSASLSVYLQGQATDEFWYTCAPTDLAQELDMNCGSGAFREGEITLDGTPAGVAPVFPWIFTGGLDPYLWAPIPGVQTLSFTPFSVPLAPFAGVLSNGAPHTIALSVFAADSNFSVAGALFVKLDPTTKVITGSVLSNNLAAAPGVNTVPKITSTSTTVSGTVNTGASHKFTIVGLVDNGTSKTINTVQENTSFYNDQYYYLTNSIYLQRISQATTTSVDESSVTKGGPSSSTRVNTYYPLTLSYHEVVDAKGNGAVVTSINQQDQTGRTVVNDGKPTNQASSANAIATTDTLVIQGGNLVANKDQAETATLLRNGTLQPCVSRTLKAAANVLTTFNAGCSSKN